MKLNYRKYGNHGPSLVILHGLLGSHGNWSSLSRHVFSDKFQVYAVDQRNHGKSPHTGPFDYGDLADDVRAFADQQDIDKMVLLGHSMGGKTAMETALRYPDIVSALIVADMAPKAYDPSHAPLLEAIARIEPSEFEVRSAIDEALARDVPQKPIRQFLLKNIDRENGNYIWQMNHAAISESYDKLIDELENGRRYQGPALFVKGEHSPYLDENDLPHIKELFPRAALETVESAGHWLHADNPDGFADVVMQFLAGLEK